MVYDRNFIPAIFSRISTIFFKDAPQKENRYENFSTRSKLGIFQPGRYVISRYTFRASDSIFFFTACIFAQRSRVRVYPYFLSNIRSDRRYICMNASVTNIATDLDVRHTYIMHRIVRNVRTNPRAFFARP